MTNPNVQGQAVLPEAEAERETADGSEGPERPGWSRFSVLCGMLAPVVFVSVFAAEGWLRPGYLPAGMFVSELSLGPRGWIQIVNFLITGSLIVVFARSSVACKVSRAGAVLLALLGGSLFASGPFVTDSSALFNQVSVHGVIHGLLGAVVFSLAPAICFVCFGHFRRVPGERRFAFWTLLAALLLIAGIVVLKASQFPESPLYAWKGLIQRVVLLTFMAWLFSFALRLFRATARTSPG